MVLVKSSLRKGSTRLGMLHAKRLLPAVIMVILLSSCALQKQEAPSQSATAAAELIEIGGGFTLAVQPDLEFEAHEDSISISDRRGELVISLNGRPYIASSYTLQSFLGKYLTEMTARGGSFQQGEPYRIVIDGQDGLAIDFSGSFLDHPIAGKAIAVSPGKDFIIFGLGMSLLNGHENGWSESGSAIFETILESIDFKEDVK